MRNRQHVEQVLSEIDLGIPKSHWELWDGALGARWVEQHPIWLVRIVTIGPSNHDDREVRRWPGRWWVITEDDTEAQVRGTMLKAVLTYMEHEHRERFTVNGEHLYEPHH